jgi:hypothetical protein
LRLRRLASILAVASFVAAALPSTLAAAAPEDDVASARKHFAEAVKRYKDGDFEGARALFLQAEGEHHAPAIVYNVARSEERLGHPQAAVDAYEAYLGEAGEKGEFAQASALALAQIRARAPKLRIETKPGGARLFLDGAPLREVSPTTTLVTPGRHHVVAEGADWRAEADVDAVDPARLETVSLAAPAPHEAAPVAPPPAQVAPTPTPAPAPLPAAGPDGLIVGGQFVLVPHRFDGTDLRRFSSFGLAAGFMAEIGFAPAENFDVLLRAMAAFGSKGDPATILGSIGIAGSYRIHRAVWIGAAFSGGRATLEGEGDPAKIAAGAQRRFDTNWVFCPSLELSVAVITRSYGQWFVSAFPGYYFAAPDDNDTLYLPIGFGLRSF